MLGIDASPTARSIRQHTSAYVSIRQHTSAYVSIRQHASAYVDMLVIDRVATTRRIPAKIHASELSAREEEDTLLSRRRPLPIASDTAYVSTRQHTPAYVSIRRRRRRALAIASASCIRQHTSADLRPHTSTCFALRKVRKEG